VTAGKAPIVGASRQTGEIDDEDHHLQRAAVPHAGQLEALFRTLQIEFERTAPGSPERTIVLASLENVRRALAPARLSRQPKP